MFNIIEKIKEFLSEMLIDSIGSSMNGIFETLSTNIAEAGDNLSQTPQGWSAEAYGFIERINTDVIVPIAGLILTAIMCLELINMVVNQNNFRDGETFSMFRYIFKMCFAVIMVTNAFTFTMAVFDVAQDLINKSLGVVTTDLDLQMSTISEYLETLKGLSIGELLDIFILITTVRLASTVMGIMVLVSVYGRMIYIYLYSSVASIPFSTFGHQEFSQIGKNYIKNLFAVGLQGLLMLLCLGIHASLTTSALMSVTAGGTISAMIKLLAYSIMLGLLLFQTKNISKSILNAH